MFDEIFKRWINEGKLTQDDIIPLFLEWNQTFGDKQATPQSVLALLECVQMDYSSILEFILKYVGIKKGYEWLEVRDINGRFLRRFWN